MFKKLMLGPLQTGCLFGTSTVSAGTALEPYPQTAGGSIFKYIL